MEEIKRWFIILLGFILLIQFVYADGCHMSDEELHLFLPDQKAVISWDGTIEEMILSSSVRSENLSNIVWIIPIQSYTKPEIEAGNISIFEDLVEYFKEEFYKGRYLEDLAGEGGVEVIESKEVDIYDITILKADNAKDLLQWLNNNGYKTPDEAEPMFEKYIKQGDMYFIANKIDLKNKHKRELELLPLAIENAKSKVIEKRDKIFEEAEAKFNAVGCSINKDYTNPNFYYDTREDCTFKKVKEKFDSAGINYTIFDVYPEVKGLLFEDGFEITWESKYYSTPLRYNIRIDDRAWKRGIGSWWDKKYYNLGDLEKYEISEYSKYKSGFSGFPYAIRATENYAALIKQALAESYEEMNDINTFIAIEDKKYSQMYDLLDREEYCAEKGSMIYNFMKFQGEDFSALCETKETLKNNMATPLKFKFEPAFPYYPLEISSLGKGSATIEVYVISETAVYDLNNVTTWIVTKEINKTLREKLNKYINVGNSTYITRLSWGGNLKGLTADMRFEEKEVYVEKYNFWQKLLHWFKNLFGRTI